MRCPICKRLMTALFLTYACDYCDGLKKPDKLYRGYVLWQGPPAREGRQVYVFPTKADAERYRMAAGLDPCEIREVLSEFDFRWHRSRGSIRDIELGERLATVFPDHRFEPGPYRVFPASAPAPAAPPAPRTTSSRR